jgi:hypothetical protein
MKAEKEVFCPIKSILSNLEGADKKKKKCCKNYKHRKRCKSCPHD